MSLKKPTETGAKFVNSTLDSKNTQTPNSAHTDSRALLLLLKQRRKMAAFVFFFEVIQPVQVNPVTYLGCEQLAYMFFHSVCTTMCPTFQILNAASVHQKNPGDTKETKLASVRSLSSHFLNSSST